MPGGPAVRPRLDGPLPGAGRLDGELARPAHAGDVGVDGVHLGVSSHRRPPGALYLTTAFSFSWPSRKMSAETATVSPTVRLTAYRPLSRTGAGFAILIRRGRSLRFGAGISAWSIRQVDHMNLSRTSGVQLHPTSLPVRTARSGGLRVDRLAGRGRPDVVADAAAGAAGRARLAVQVGVGVRGLAARCWPSRPRRSPRPSAGLPRAGRRLDRGLDRVRGRGRAGRPGALRPRVGGAARVRRRARREADRRHPDLRRRGLGRRSSRTRRSSSAGVVAGVPPDAFTDKGQLWGNPVYDWPALRRQRLRVVDRALQAHLRALRPRADRPLPRLHGLLGGAGGRRVRLGGLLEARPGRARRSTPPARRWASCR